MKNLLVLIDLLKQAWSADTSYDRNEWSRRNPARGQCVVSSLVLQDYIGGDILRFKAVYKGNQESHYCNTVDGVLIDSTRSQYPNDIVFNFAPVSLDGFGSMRERLLSYPDTLKKYKLLKSRIDKNKK